MWKEKDKREKAGMWARIMGWLTGTKPQNANGRGRSRRSKLPPLPDEWVAKESRTWWKRWVDVKMSAAVARVRVFDYLRLGQGLLLLGALVGFMYWRSTAECEDGRVQLLMFLKVAAFYVCFCWSF